MNSAKTDYDEWLVTEESAGGCLYRVNKNYESYKLDLAKRTRAEEGNYFYYYYYVIINKK